MSGDQGVRATPSEPLDDAAWASVWHWFGALEAASSADREQAMRAAADELGQTHGGPLAARILEEVTAMLSAQDDRLSIESELEDDDSSTAFEGEADGSFDARLASSASPRVPGYRILGEIGRGGMSDVYMARRAEAAFDQRLAIKVLRRGLRNREMIERFQRERDLLIRIEHPAIVSLVDAGTTGDGRPFLVLNYVEGEPITGYCTASGLMRRQVLELFVELCAAVQYAHANLVVHRDLKPSNVLVTADGRLQLLDFGVAKILALDEDSELTTDRRAPMTRRRAAPEQRGGGEITTATDVWALGLLLHELLVGVLPTIDFAVEPTAGGSSANTTTEDLPKDLALIIEKCLQAHPSARYASAQHLADDLGRYLRNEPVLARRAGLGYRFQRFVRRNLVASGLATVLALAVIAFAGFSLLQSRRLERERDRADLERQNASATLDLLVEILEESDPVTGEPRATIEIDQMLQRAEDVARSLDEDPLVQARLRQVLGSLSANRGNLKRSEELLQQVAHTFETHLGPDAPATLTARLDLAQLRHRLHGDLEGARREAAALEARLRDLPTPPPELAAQVYRLLGTLHPDESGEVYLERAISHFREVGDQRELAGTLSNLSMIRAMRGDRAGARAAGEESLRLSLALEDTSSFMTLALRSNLANLIDDPQERLGEHEAVLRERIALLGERHRHVSNSYFHLGSTLNELGRHEEAALAFQGSARALAEQSGAGHGSGHADHGAARLVNRALREQARSLHLAGETSAARELFDSLLTGRSSVVLLPSAYVWFALGDVEAAATEAQEVIDSGDSAIRHIRALALLARVDAHRGHYAAAQGRLATARTVLSDGSTARNSRAESELDVLDALVSHCLSEAADPAATSGSGLDSALEKLESFPIAEPLDLQWMRSLVNDALPCSEALALPLSR